MKFNDKVIDTQLLAELRDFVTVLSKQEDLEFDYHFGATIHIDDRQITASHFWDHRDEQVRSIGYKTDILLRSIGTMHYTSVSDWQKLKREVSQSPLPYFCEQLFTILEDVRLEEMIRSERRGTINWFRQRLNTYRHYFETQLNTNITRSYTLDELFCMIFLTVTSESPFVTFEQANDQQRETLKRLQPLLESVYEARSTKDVVNLTLDVKEALEEDYSDMINRYFVYPIQHQAAMTEEKVVDELKRVDPLNNDDEEDINDDDEVISETFSTWHRENENSDRNQSFMQFELEQGTKTNLIGDGARQTEEGDQAMASVQGMSAQTDQSEYEHLESLDEQKNKEANESEQYGKENRNTIKLNRYPTKPGEEDQAHYNELTKTIDPIRRKLSQTIDRALEHKQNATRQNLITGRLSKKQLLPLVIDNDPRVFYKNDLESHEFDAVFTLLIDCSASMFNKMDETKKAAILFHEVLKELKIKHNVIGFWEDGFDAKDDEQPNYFHRVITFDESLQTHAGPEILQLDPEEDNRDGYTIRVATEELLARQEKDRFLLVFSDGEPSAFNYSENGIIDTHEAVLEARKQNVDVVGIFLGEGEIKEHEAMLMRNIYGREHMLIPDLAELPDSFSYILKRLLLTTI
ncbi:vWA domain-containing protein [Alkalibacillus haloalkaliphilus]|uniref:vWA domain-containing protein n=1 Tax=Alkalibacillus haloalkaliphilus TaxID=94136 RepID=UPI0029364D1F|nr:VWA domain-containing protein [Alkalibacillus haloalkaliphilus]MDV2582023.1 VWA domain-containing protein [Alkalibacillus haloalkaliphilus]